MVGIDAALIMNPKVWEASGHLSNFIDPLVECKKCHTRSRVDELKGATTFVDPKDPSHRGFQIGNETVCSNCDSQGTSSFTTPTEFNLMLKTFLGPAEEKANEVYLRPETAQAMFVDFKQILDTTRKKLPFGIAQTGKAFRNEITPGNFIFRTREFEQMEIEYFIREADWKDSFEYWRKEMWSWITDDLGVQESRVHELEVPDGERAHYSKRTIDFEYDYPFGKKELYGLAYRTDFDLKNHFKQPPYKDQETGEAFYPHVVEPTWGVDRSVLVVLLDAYAEDGERVILKLKPRLAPYKAAVFPLLANKPDLVAKAREIYQLLTTNYSLRGPVAWDDRGNIGKRYYAQDEIGTPYCITVDFDTLEKGDVTVRDRDTAKQERIKIEELAAYLAKKIR